MSELELEEDVQEESQAWDVTVAFSGDVVPLRGGQRRPAQFQASVQVEAESAALVTNELVEKAVRDLVASPQEIFSVTCYLDDSEVRHAPGEVRVGSRAVQLGEELPVAYGPDDIQPAK